MAKYHKRSDGLFETSRMVNGKRVYFRAKTCAEIDRKILAYHEERKRGRKFGVIAEAWFAEKEKEVRVGTTRAYRFALNLCSELNDRYASEFTPLDVKRFVNTIEGRGYSGETVSQVLRTVKAVFSYAVIAGDIDVSPATEINRTRNLPKTKRAALTEEQERLVEAYRGEDYLLGLVLLYTGMRRGEAIAITWSDINRQRGVISVTKKVNYTTSPITVDHFLKSENGRRDVPILAPLAAALPDNRIGLVFGDEKGQHLTIQKFRARWRRYCINVGLVDEKGEPNVTPHQFRHSFATICYEAGIDSMSAAAMMGDTPEVVSRIYTELRKSHHEQSAERVSAYLELRAEERENTVRVLGQNG